MKKLDLQNTFWVKVKGILLVMLITALISGGAFNNLSSSLGLKPINAVGGAIHL